MTTVFVGNLASATTDDDLREMFGLYGEVASASVEQDRNTGRSRGFAFVEMTSGGGDAILALNGTAVGGRPLSVSEAKPRAPRTPPAGVPWS